MVIPAERAKCNNFCGNSSTKYIGGIIAAQGPAQKNSGNYLPHGMKIQLNAVFFIAGDVYILTPLYAHSFRA